MRYTGKGRQARAKVARDDMRRVLDGLTDQRLDDLLARGQMRARDGFPSSASGASDIHGGRDATPTEAAALAGLPQSDYDAMVNGEEVRGDDWAKHDHPHDPIADEVGKLMVALLGASRRLGDVERIARYVANAGASNAGRVSALAGSCQACGRPVACNAKDPMRGGYCGACDVAWRRAGRLDRAAFERSRKAEQEGGRVIAFEPPIASNGGT